MAIRTAAFTAIGALAVCGATVAPPANGTSASTEVAERAETTAIQPGTLDRGRRPQSLHMRNHRIYDGKKSFKANGPKRDINLVGKGDGRYLIVRYGQYDGMLWQIRPKRKAHRLGVVEQAAYNGGDEYTVNDIGNRLAITEPERAGFMVWVRALPSGKQLDFRAPWTWTRTVAFPNNRVLFTTPKSTYWYAPKQRKRTKIADDESVIAGPEQNRLVVRGDKGEARFQLVEFRDPSEVVAEWERGRAFVISPNGKYFLAKDGTQRLQVRRLDDGALVRTFTAAGRIDTDSARWESNRRVTFTAKGHEVAANVRCTVGGDCERTTRLAKRPGRLGLDWPGK